MKQLYTQWKNWRARLAGLKHIASTAGIFLLLALVLELTLFNYKFYMTMFQDPLPVTELTASKNMELREDGSYLVSGANQAYVEIKGLNRHVSTLYLNVYRENKRGADQLITPVTLYVTDAANSQYMKLPSRNILPFVKHSQYMTLHLAGDTDKIKILFDADENDRIYINGLTVNPVIPMQISPLRISLLALILTVLFYLRPKAGYFRIPYRKNSRRQQSVTSAAMSIQILLFAAVICINPWFLDPSSRHHKQYHELAVAISEGHVYLDQEPPESLINMENPYDSAQREIVMDESDSSYLFDHAYYDGKYYVYFGVLPVLIFYLPWYLITGSAFPTFLGVLITGIIFIFAVYRLMALLIQRFDSKKIPYPVFLLLTTLFINSCGVLAIIRRPDFYSLPIIMGVTLSILGLNCWLSSIRPDRILKGKIFLGCLFMALVAACRPQICLGSLLIFPIFWDAVFRKRLLFSKKGLAPTLLAALPYVLVACGLMYYNFIRFGSPLDFGANYNLTTNDMTNRGIVAARLPIGLFTYLFQPPVITSQFPFINKVTLQTAYLGRTISEGTFGGFFAVNLISLSGLFLFRIRKWFSDRRLWTAGVCAMLLAVLIICIDPEGAGILLRYYSDFGWLIMLASVLAVLAASVYLAGRPCASRGLWLYLAAAFVAGMAFHLLLVFTDGAMKLQDLNPELFYYFYYHLQFWQ